MYIYIGSMDCEVAYNQFHKRCWDLKSQNYIIPYENIEC